MMENAFIGKVSPPTPKELERELGPSTQLWTQLVNELRDKFGVNEHEWTSHSPKAGWSLRLKRKKRAIVYLGPCHGSFRIALVLGGKAMKSAQEIKFPAHVLRTLEEATRYPEGYALRFEVKGPGDIEAVERLAQVKIEN